MIWFFLIEIFILFLLSRLLTVSISQLFFILTRSEKLSIWLMSLLFLPGTVIHELSHLFMAKLLFVHTGKVSLIPESHGNTLKLGSVEVGKTDFIRNFLIGVAPFVIGFAIIILSILFFLMSGGTKDYLILAIVIYIVFIVSNTMFSSRKDLEGAIEFLILCIFIMGILYLSGVNPIDMISSIKPGNENLILLIPIGIDIVLIILIKSAFLFRKN